MSNFKQDILDYVGEETIKGIVIGAFGWGCISNKPELGYGEESKPFIPFENRGKILKPEEALPLLDYEYDTSFGAPDCHAIYIWTNKSVIWVTQYDGATSFSFAPRNPINIIPDMPGG